MSESLRLLIETVFNCSYLLIIWIIVFKMKQRKSQTISAYIYWAFLLLAIGDTGHVGFRVIAVILGDLDYTIQLFGELLLFRGIGSLMTAITVTAFYMLFVQIWYEKFKGSTIVYTVLQAVSVLRIILMLLPQNQWFIVEGSYLWSLIRNIPLMIVGLSLVVLFFKQDQFYRKIAWTILMSYVFYMPVIFFVRQVPILGMLMIPKTIAYLVLALIMYKEYFKKQNQSLENQNNVS